MSGFRDTCTMPQEQYGYFSVVLLHLKKDSPLTSIVYDSHLTKFTPETPEVFCGLKHFTRPSISIVMRR